MKCRICGNESGNKTYDVREMMYGFRDVFRYFRCASCECLQIAEYPPDMAKYYPSRYYSLGAVAAQASTDGLRKLTNRLRYNHVVFNRGVAGRFLNAVFPSRRLLFLKYLSLTRDMRILEIGCGGGGLLYFLSGMGCENLLGVDPFIEKTIEYENGLRIVKDEIRNIKGSWDLVMLHHSLEHIPSQEEALRAVSGLLAPGGRCVIRIPVSSSYAWEHYGVHWVQLDAPRHFYLHSVRSMERLADRAGLEVVSVVYDSNAFQIWGSEQYLKDIPLRDGRSYASGIGNSIFTRRDMWAFKRQARKLNAARAGDQAIFYLRKA